MPSQNSLRAGFFRRSPARRYFGRGCAFPLPATATVTAVAKKFEARVDEVRRAAQQPESKEHRDRLTKVFNGKQGYLISLAAAALPTGGRHLVQCATEAFVRLKEDAIKRDPQCYGKQAIAQSLYDADISAEDVFLAGVQHVQLEPVMGGRQDTAAALRGVCLMALVHAQHPRALVHAATMLADHERAARLAALRALAASGRPDVAEPLTRLRLASGDDDPEVITECMSTLLALNPSDNLAVVGTHLAGKDSTMAEAAALAVGATRVAGGFGLLRDQLELGVLADRRRTLMLAMAMLRSDTAWQHLVEIIMDAPSAEALDAIDALGTFKEHGDLRQRVEAAVMDRADPDVDARFARSFA